MEYQAFIVIFGIIFFHIFILNKFKFRFKSEKFEQPKQYNCGDCYQNKTKDICEKSTTGKYCDTPCKWSKTSRINSDGSLGFKEFCEENKSFYHLTLR